MPRGRKSLAVVESSSNNLALSTPDYIKPGNIGKEGFRREDLKIPFLRLAQRSTPLVIQGVLKEGDFFNSLSRKNYGQTVHFIPIIYQFKRMMFEAYDEGGGILCQAPDGKKAIEPKGKDAKGRSTDVCAECVYSQWSEKKNGGKQPPRCCEQGAYVVLIPGESTPCVLIFQNTSFPAHRALASMIAQSQFDIYGNLFKLSSKQVENYRVMEVEAAGWPSREDYELAKSMRNAYLSTFSRSAIDDPQN